MTEDTATSAPCPACRADSRRLGVKKDHAIFQCGACGFLFVHPYPTPQELARYYGTSYRGATAEFYPKLKSRKRRAFIKSFRFLRHIRGKKALDIGCGGGVMADAFRRLGADAHGVDISANSIAFARQNFPGCTFYCEDFDDMRRRDVRFDFMFTSELLEHIAGIHPCLAMIDALAAPGAVVYMATPDSGHPTVPSDVIAWDEISPPEHLQWFSQANLARAMGEYGFDLIKAYRKTTPALSLVFKKR